MTKACLFLFSFLLLVSCHEKKKAGTKSGPHCAKELSLPVKYAKGFSVGYYNGFKVISVRDWKKPDKILAQYVLRAKGKSAPLDFPTATLIDTPVRKIICISTNHISSMGTLGLLDSIAAVANVALIYNEEVQNMLREGRMADVGKDELNYEKLLELQPSFVFTSGHWDGGDKMIQKLNALHVKTVLNLDYMEQEPLARAEWLKFVAAFYDREVEADSLFTEVEAKYSRLLKLAEKVPSKPTVLVNMPFKEIWYMPCGDNYMAKLIADAGGDFIWKDTKATNELNLNLDYESVYSKASGADIWLCNSFAGSLAEIKGTDTKNALFKAFKTKNVYNNNKRNTPSGGFDFWESGALQPDKILADLISIFHPQLLPDHTLYYYQKLK